MTATNESDCRMWLLRVNILEIRLFKLERLFDNETVTQSVGD